MVAPSHMPYPNRYILTGVGNEADELCQQLKGFLETLKKKKPKKHSTVDLTASSICYRNKTLCLEGVIKLLTIHLTLTPLAMLVK